MIHTAQIKEENHLTLSDEHSKTLSPNTQNSRETSGTISAVNPLFNKVSPFFYNERIRLSLLTSDEYRADFILIKGLIEFYRPKNLNFTYDRQQGLIAIDIHVDQLDRLESFLSSILDWVRQEKQFRNALKNALAFESRYRSERESVYQMLRTSYS